MQLFQALLILIALAVGLACVGIALARRARPRRNGAVSQPNPKPNSRRTERRAGPAAAEPSGQVPVERRRSGDTLVQHPSYYAEAETYDAVINRLDRAFDLFERKRISQDTFYELVLIEKKALFQRRADLMRAEHASPSEEGAAAIEDIDQAIGAVKWCIDWCEQNAAQEGDAGMRHAAE